MNEVVVELVVHSVIHIPAGININDILKSMKCDLTPSDEYAGIVDVVDSDIVNSIIINKK